MREATAAVNRPVSVAHCHRLQTAPKDPYDSLFHSSPRSPSACPGGPIKSLRPSEIGS